MFTEYICILYICRGNGSKVANVRMGWQIANMQICKHRILSDGTKEKLCVFTLDIRAGLKIRRTSTTGFFIYLRA